MGTNYTPDKVQLMMKPLTPRQQRAIFELLSPEKQSIETIAKKIGVTSRTLSNWQSLPQFAERLREEQEKLRNLAYERLRGLLWKAIDKLELHIMSRDEEVSLRAIRTVLEYNMKLADLKEMEERLRRLKDEPSRITKEEILAIIKKEILGLN